MSEFDIFPTLDEPRATTPRAAVATTQRTDIAAEEVDLQKIALAHFDASRAALATATAKLTDVVHDLSTAGKLAEAKSLRNRLINLPLAEARKVSAGLKSKLASTSTAVGIELTSIEAGFEAAKNLITPQIDARDAEVAAEKAAREAKEAAEKAERERVEAIRVDAHRANIAKLAGYVGQAQGKTSEQILSAINGVAAYIVDPAAWEEFAVGAEVQKAETLEALHALFDRTKAAEVESAAHEARRIENERKAAELAEQQRLLAEKQAELDAKLAAIAAAEKSATDKAESAAQAARDAEAKAQREAQEAVDALARQVAEDEANVKSQVAAAALQELADTGHGLSQDTLEEVSDDALAARPEIAAQITAINAPAAAGPAMHAASTPDMEEVTARAWGIPEGPVTFASGDSEPMDHLAVLLAHIDGAFTGRFSSHPKPTREWWGALRRLSDDARASAAG